MLQPHRYPLSRIIITIPIGLVIIAPAVIISPLAAVGIPQVPPAAGPATLRPASAPASVEYRMPIRAGDLSLQRVAGSWQLRHGLTLFRDFGDDEVAARAALVAFRDMRPTEWVVIGSPQPLVEYGLVNGRPPLLLTRPPAEPRPGASPAAAAEGPFMTGVGFHAVQPIDLKSVRAEEVRGVWCLRDDYAIHCNFALSRAAAETAVAAIRKHGLNRLGVIGGRRPVMRCLFAASDPGIEPLPPALVRQQVQMQIEALNPTGVPVPGVGYVGLMYRYDPRRLEVRKDGAEWVIAHEAVILGRFGPAELTARDALRTIQDFGWSEWCQVGRLTFFLHNGQPPRRVPLHVQVRTFDPATLRVQRLPGRCFLSDQGRHLCDCTDPAEGELMLRVVQAMGLDTLCQLGPAPRGGITFFARQR